jgi:hypothetical protein
VNAVHCGSEVPLAKAASRVRKCALRGGFVLQYLLRVSKLALFGSSRHPEAHFAPPDVAGDGTLWHIGGFAHGTLWHIASEGWNDLRQFRGTSSEGGIALLMVPPKTRTNAVLGARSITREIGDARRNPC